MTELNATSQPGAPIAIGSRLELLVDDYLIEQMRGSAALHLHQPVLREVVMRTDEPWEGNASLYSSIFQDGARFRMYYGSQQYDVGEGVMTYPHPGFLCYAESADGIHWRKPALDQVEFNGSTQNNILRLVSDRGDPALIDDTHVAVFKDTNPHCPPEVRYKALARGKNPLGLYAFGSADGIRFTRLRGQPILTQGYFDSLNLAFWDGSRGEYRAYLRDFDGGVPDGVRGILTATSQDFIHWTEPTWLRYPDAPIEQLYTNQIQPYARAPHIFIGFPMRYVDRGWTAQTDFLPELEPRRRRAAVSPRYGSAVTDGLFMSSRDGLTFKRWGEAFIRPGLRPQDNWVYGDNCVAWGLVETRSELAGAPNELSLYATESYWRGRDMHVRRYSLRLDGFVSVQAPLSGGEFVSKPVLFAGAKLVMNFSTSAAGSIRVELQDAVGEPLAGFTLADCPEIFGDSLEQIVHWRGGSGLGSLAGKPIRLRFVLKDADLYSIRFGT